MSRNDVCNFLSAADRKFRSATTTATREHAYCQSEYFRVRCGVGEVLVITHARYGRMRISRCVREHFGYVDCSVDVAEVLDRHCSGRRSCSIRVLDDNFNNVRPCHDDLKSYLEVRHHCLKGTINFVSTFAVLDSGEVHELVIIIIIIIIIKCKFLVRLLQSCT